MKAASQRLLKPETVETERLVKSLSRPTVHQLAVAAVISILNRNWDRALEAAEEVALLTEGMKEGDIDGEETR